MTAKNRTSTQIIAGLAHACGLEWARCRGAVLNFGTALFDECGMACGHEGKHRGRLGNAPPWDEDDPIAPTIWEWAAEWLIAHPGEPGPVSEWTSPDRRVWWGVNDFGVCIRVGKMHATRALFGGWDVGGEALQGDDAPQELARLMAAADGTDAP